MGGRSPSASQAHFRLGILDEEDGAFGSSLEHYRASIDRGSATTWSRAARVRIAWIEQRSEGDFRPLAALQRVRLASAAGREGSAIERLARETDTFPPGRVRVEARLLVAHAWLVVPAHREEALEELRKVIEDPRAGARGARLAQRELVTALLEDHRLDQAAAEVRTHSLDLQLADEVRRLVRRKRLRLVTYSLLAMAVIAATLILASRTFSRRSRPLAG